MTRIEQLQKELKEIKEWFDWYVKLTVRSQHFLGLKSYQKIKRRDKIYIKINQERQKLW
jgi:hypothetical protein